MAPDTGTEDGESNPIFKTPVGAKASVEKKPECVVCSRTAEVSLPRSANCSLPFRYDAICLYRWTKRSSHSSGPYRNANREKPVQYRPSCPMRLEWLVLKPEAQTRSTLLVRPGGASDSYGTASDR